MKIVFLDVDGVMNSNDWYVRRSTEVEMDDIASQYPFYEFDPKAVARLNRITDETGAKIVLSSTWRHGRTIEQLKDLFVKVGITGELIDKTISINAAGNIGYTIPRGCEIDYWLDKHDFQRINWSKKTQEEYLAKSQVQNYIILDDDSDMLYNQREHFVKTPHMMGLTDAHVEQSITILNTTLMDLYYPKTTETNESETDQD